MIEAEIREPTPTPTAAVRVSRAMSELDLGELFGASYEALHDWIHAQGAGERPSPCKAYVDDPSEVDEAELRTEIYWSIA